MEGYTVFLLIINTCPECSRREQFYRVSKSPPRQTTRGPASQRASQDTGGYNKFGGMKINLDLNLIILANVNKKMSKCKDIYAFLLLLVNFYKYHCVILTAKKIKFASFFSLI